VGFKKVLAIEVLDKGEVLIEESEYLQSLPRGEKIKVLTTYLESLKEDLVREIESYPLMKDDPYGTPRHRNLRKEITVTKAYISILEKAYR
jgi:hypothetical protein